MNPLLPITIGIAICLIFWGNPIAALGAILILAGIDLSCRNV